MAKNIILTGFMGVGKGQVARQLSILSGWIAVDCDDLIESMMNMKIKKIFAYHGEEKFRELERETARWLQKNVKKTVVSTGGGFVNVPNLKKLGSVFYLHAEFDYIVERLMNHPNAAKKVKKRPLLQDLASAKKLHKTRMPIYKKTADHLIDVTGKDVEEISAIIWRKMKKS